MKISDVAVGIGIDGVVRRVRVQFHDLLELPVVFGFGAGERLCQCLDRFLHQSDAHPFSILGANDRAVLGAVNGEDLFPHAGVCLVWHFDN